MEKKVREQNAGKSRLNKTKENHLGIEKKDQEVLGLNKNKQKKMFPLYCCSACWGLNVVSLMVPLVTHTLPVVPEK